MSSVCRVRIEFNWWRACLGVFLLGIAPIHPARADLSGSATVIDGDSLIVAGRRLQLHAVAAPDPAAECTPTTGSWRCGHLATLSLTAHVTDRELRCITHETSQGAWPATCFLDQENLNAWLVTQGWALAANGDNAYRDAEEQARRQAKGVWRDNFEPPSEWRTPAQSLDSPPFVCDSCALRKQRLKRN